MPDSTQPAEVEVPPFPRLRWAEYFWEGTVTLPAWAGFQSRGGAYGSRDSKEPSDGRAHMYVESPHVNNREPPSAAQRRAFEMLLSRQDRIRDAMLAALSAEYETWRAASAGAMDEDEFAELMPPVSTAEGFRSLIGLSTVHVHTVEKGGLAYVGSELGCTWDEEHGVGFMMHGDRVVDLGGADTSSLAWIAKKDLNAGGREDGA